jgi:hypothetical protein
MLTDYHPSTRPHQDQPQHSKKAKQDRVSSLQYRWQSEWELWAYVVDHFLDEDAHRAYVAKQAASGQLALAAKRYQEYLRLLTLPGLETAHSQMAKSWQKKISDIAFAQFQQIESESTRWNMPLTLIEIAPRLGKSLWFMAGFLLIWVFIL